MLKELRVAVIGAGFTGYQHTEAARRVPGVRIVALADANIELARLACDRLGIPSPYQDYKEMLKRGSFATLRKNIRFSRL